MSHATAPEKGGKTAFHPEQFDLVSLGRHFDPEVVQILEEVRQNLPDGTKHFIKPQTLRDLFKHHARKLPVVGSIEKSSGKVAGVLLITPSEHMDYNRHMSKYPTLIRECDTAIIGSVAAAPGYGGQMQPLLAAAEGHAASMGLLGVWAKVSVANEASNHNFSEAGWTRKVHGFDPDLGHPVSYWRKNLSGVAPSALPLFNGKHEPESEYVQPVLPRFAAYGR